MRIEGNARIIYLPVQAGFRYKNQRFGRCPPDISIKSLVRGSNQICPVKTLIAYKRRTNIKEGKLLVNSRSTRPLHPSSIPHFICHLINEADPGKFPRAHDVRKTPASLAWLRGLRVKIK